MLNQLVILFLDSDFTQEGLEETRNVPVEEPHVANSYLMKSCMPEEIEKATAAGLGCGSVSASFF